MIVKALAKTLYALSESLIRRHYQEKMMAHHLRLCRTQMSAMARR